MTDPYPIVLEPILMPKVWGGRRLTGLGKQLPTDEPFGESWEVADLGATSTTGGGGGAACSKIRNGPLAGQTLSDAVSAWNSDMHGSVSPTPDGRFPLLVKYLDAREHLSVQVHPSPAFAAANPGAHLKTESWLILRADAGPDGEPAVIYKGLTPGTTRTDLERAIRDGTVPELMVAEEAVVGACHTLPSGTVHALGAGVLVAEVQTPSDTTFRVYDWVREYGRPERELHIDQALQCASCEPAPGAQATSDRRAVLSDTDFYSIERVRASCEVVEVRSTDSPIVVMATRTMGCSVASASSAFDEVMLSAGDTAVIPASCAADSVLRAGPETELVLARAK